MRIINTSTREVIELDPNQIRTKEERAHGTIIPRPDLANDYRPRTERKPGTARMPERDDPVYFGAPVTQPQKDYHIIVTPNTDKE